MVLRDIVKESAGIVLRTWLKIKPINYFHDFHREIGV